MTTTIIKKLLSFAAFCSLMTPAFPAEVQPFQFIQMSDVHISESENDKSKSLMAAIEDIKKNYPNAAFAICCGDLTEMGYKEEFAHYQKIMSKLGKTVYGTIGNHDVRWSENGKENFRDVFKNTYQSFTHNGVRFVIMDVAMLLEHYGHFDGVKMAQLKQDLEALDKDQPMFISYHQPILAGDGFVDNEFIFADAIRPYNVPLIMEGHGHRLTMKTVNGTLFAMGGSTFGLEAYRVWNVDKDQITGDVRYFKKDKTETVTTIPLVKKPTPPNDVFEIEQDKCTAKSAAFIFKSDAITSETKPWYTIDNCYSGEAIDIDDGLWKTQDYPLPVGLHQLVVSYKTGEASKEAYMKPFKTVAPDGKPPILEDKIMQLGSGAQSGPAIKGDNLYVGCNDGKLYCFDLKTADVKWTTDLKREIISTPQIMNDKIYIGSMDKKYYCINCKDGKIVWETPVYGAVQGTLLVTDSLVVGGSGDGGVHALDRLTGKEVWKYQTGKFVKMQPVLADDGKSIIFAGWDNKIVKVDAQTGKQQWAVDAAASIHVSCATSNIIVKDDIVICAPHDYKVHALNAATGERLWSWDPPTTPTKRLGPSYSSPAIKDDTVYFGTIDGYLIGFDIKTGQMTTDLRLRNERTDEIFDSSSIIVGNKLYVGSIGGNVYCVDLDKDEVAWTVSLAPGFILTTPAYKDGKLYVSSLNNAVYTIDTEAAKK